jgi:hypothetical protein
MRVITILENEYRMRTIHVDRYRIDVFDSKDRKYMIRSDLRDLDVDTATAWEILARITPAIAAEEDKRDALDALADRCRSGWTPTPGEIPGGMPQTTLTHWTMAVDGIAFPESDEWYSPATKLMGRDADGRGHATGTILWIAADRSFAVCDDGVWWMRGEAE